MSYLEVWHVPRKKKKNREMTLYGEFYGYGIPSTTSEDSENPIDPNSKKYIPPIKQIKSYVLFRQTFKMKNELHSDWRVIDVHNSIVNDYEILYNGFVKKEAYDHRQWIADEIIANGGITHDDYIDEANAGGYIP